MTKDNYCSNYIQTFVEVLSNTQSTRLDESPLELDQAVSQLCVSIRETVEAGGRMYFIGNGASASFADHMALDWSKNAKVPSVSFNSIASFTAAVNDIGADEAFASLLKWYSGPKDVLVAISSSGNSPNIVNAAIAAREMGQKIFTVSGLNANNRLRKLGDINLYTPGKTYGIVESAHQLLLHVWLDRYMGITEWDRTTIQNMRIGEFQL